MHLAALTYIRRAQREEEKLGTVAGWHGQRIHLHPPCSPPEFVREVEMIPYEFRRAGKTHLGRDGSGISGWDGHTGRDGPPRPGTADGHPSPRGLHSTDGSGLILPTTPLPPKCQPALFSLFQSVIFIIIIIIFLPCFPSQH